MSWYVGLNGPIYMYNQNNSPTWDSQPDENSYDNCGPTCDSMVLKHLRDVYIPPDTIKDVILGENKTGTTNETQLAGFLKNYANVSSTFYYPTDMQNSSKTGVLDITWQYLYNKKPLICLGLLNLAGTNYRHWRIIKGLSDTTVFMVDPWYGAEVDFSWTDFKSNFQGILIGIEDSRLATTL